SLLVFQASMRKARIKPVHTLRCALYSCDWAWLLTLVICMLLWNPLRILDFLPPFLVIGPPVYVLFRLWRAYRYYMRFPHAFATVLASQLIVWLFAFVVALNIGLSLS